MQCLAECRTAITALKIADMLKLIQLMSKALLVQFEVLGGLFQLKEFLVRFLSVLVRFTFEAENLFGEVDVRLGLVKMLIPE